MFDMHAQTPCLLVHHFDLYQLVLNFVEKARVVFSV